MTPTYIKFKKWRKDTCKKNNITVFLQTLLIVQALRDNFWIPSSSVLSLSKSTLSCKQNVEAIHILYVLVHVHVCLFLEVFPASFHANITCSSSAVCTTCI